MRTDQLIATVRMNVGIEDTHPDYTDARILIELSDALTTTFERAVVAARNGYWCKPFLYTVVAGASKYRIPARSCGIEKVDLGVGAVPQFMRLPELSEAHAELAERPASITGQPVGYVIRGDQVVLLPVPDGGTYTLRVWYYVRPSRLVPPQTGGTGGGTVRGQVTGVNVSTRQITVNAIPVDMDTIATMGSGVQKIDVVHPDGWHELALVAMPQTYSGTVFTVVGTDDLAEIAIGDFVRVAEQTDWPCLPDDYHRCLADIASVKILLQMDQPQKASGFAQSVNADVQRFVEMIQPRVKSEAKVVRAPLPYLRGRRMVNG
jgi:hypothetical protein